MYTYTAGKMVCVCTVQQAIAKESHPVDNVNRFHNYPRQLHISQKASLGHSVSLQIHRHHAAQAAAQWLRCCTMQHSVTESSTQYSNTQMITSCCINCIHDILVITKHKD